MVSDVTRLHEQEREHREEANGVSRWWVCVPATEVTYRERQAAAEARTAALADLKAKVKELPPFLAGDLQWVQLPAVLTLIADAAQEPKP